MSNRTYFSRTLSLPASSAAVSVLSLITTSIGTDTPPANADIIINPCGSLNIQPLAANASSSFVLLGDSVANIAANSFGQQLSPGQSKFYPFGPARGVHLDKIFIAGSTSGLSVNIEVTR